MTRNFEISGAIVNPLMNAIERDGTDWHLEPRVMQVLLFLVEHRGNVCTKERLTESVWQETFVSEDALVRCISEIRRVFGDDPRTPRVIQTIHKVGYRLIADVVFPEVPSPVSPPLEHAVPLAAQGKNPPCQNGQTEAQPIEGTHVPEQHERQVERRSLWKSRRIATTLAVLVCLLGAGLYFVSRPTAYRRFWQSNYAAGEGVILCMPDQSQYNSITLRDSNDPSIQKVLPDKLTAVVIDDMEPMIAVSLAIREHGGSFIVRGQDAVTLSDLRGGPGVFIGAFDNPWTLRLTAPLRYHFTNNAEMTEFGIEDSVQNSRRWIVDREHQKATNNYRDFALIANFRDSITGKPALVVAGVGRGGTIAAGEFLSTPKLFDPLLRSVQATGKLNFEAVLSTQIVDGHPGSSKVEAMHAW